MPISAKFGINNNAYHGKEAVLLISIGKGLKGLNKNPESELEYFKSFIRAININYKSKPPIIPTSLKILAAGTLQRWNFDYFIGSKNCPRTTFKPLSHKLLSNILNERRVIFRKTPPLDFKSYINSYLFIQSTRELVYITRKGICKPLTIHRLNIMEKMWENNDTEETLITEESPIASVVEDIIAMNPGHSALNSHTNEHALSQLLAKEFYPYARAAENRYMTSIKTFHVELPPQIIPQFSGWKKTSEEKILNVENEYNTDPKFAALIDIDINNFLRNKDVPVQKALQKIKKANPKLNNESLCALKKISCRFYLFEEFQVFLNLKNTGLFYPGKIPQALKYLIKKYNNDLLWCKLEFRHVPSGHLDDLHLECARFSDDANRLYTKGISPLFFSKRERTPEVSSGDLKKSRSCSDLRLRSL